MLSHLCSQVIEWGWRSWPLSMIIVPFLNVYIYKLLLHVTCLISTEVHCIYSRLYISNGEITLLCKGWATERAMDSKWRSVTYQIYTGQWWRPLEFSPSESRWYLMHAWSLSTASNMLNMYNIYFVLV